MNASDPKKSYHQATLEYKEKDGGISRYTIVHGEPGVKPEGHPTEDGLIKAAELLKHIRQTMGRYIEK